jgi:two-component system chemotaxis response regulator CheY
MRVMVIDNSKLMRNIQRAVLGMIGVTEVVQASDGLDALSKVGAFNPDLILCGWNMPNMDGLAFVKSLRRRARRRNYLGKPIGKQPPVIMVTHQKHKERVLQAIEAGVSNYVVKPFTPELLIARVEETLARLQAS